MKFCKVNFNKGEYYYVGEAYDSGRGYVAHGFGAMKTNSNKHVICCNNWTNNDYAGLGFEYYPNDKHGALTTFVNGDYYGPTMIFGYEKYLIYRNFDYNHTPHGMSVHVFYNGNYVIYEETKANVIDGVAYFDGYLYFVKLDQKFNVLNKKLIKYVGEEYKFTAKRMFCMELDYSREIFNKSGTTSDGIYYDLGTQILTPHSNTYWGYGAIKWNDGSYYLGEWYDDNREGIGCYVDSDGTKHLGKYYENKKYGNVLSIYSSGVIRMGNWERNSREGISFEIYEDCVVIINYKNNKVYGNKFQVKQHAEYVTEFYNSGKDAVYTGRYYY